MRLLKQVSSLKALVLGLFFMSGVSANPVLVPGVWTALGPPGIANAAYGCIDIIFDPSNHSTLYTTVQDNGLWKSTDGGSSWVQLGAGYTDPNPWDDTTGYLDVPFYVRVDPADSKHLYATVGVRGQEQGFWTSTDGGVTWIRPAAFSALAKSTTTDDVTAMAIDPTDFKHILLSSHSPWQGDVPMGVLESTDGGANWIIHPPSAGFNGSQTFGIEFLYDPAHGINDTKTWLYMGTNGFFRTTDAGATWATVSSTISSPHGLDVLHRAKNGDLYAGAFQYPVRSTDNGMTWQYTSTGLTYSEYYCIMSDGTNLYTGVSTGSNNPPDYIMTSKESDGLNWTKCDGGKESFVDGPITMAFDSVNQIMYAACWHAGILALKIPGSSTEVSVSPAKAVSVPSTSRMCEVYNGSGRIALFPNIAKQNERVDIYDVKGNLIGNSQVKSDGSIEVDKNKCGRSIMIAKVHDAGLSQ